MNSPNPQSTKVVTSLCDELSRRGIVGFERDDQSVTVKATSDNGFDATFYACEPEYVVSLGGWHDDYRGISAAKSVFLKGLTSAARLRVLMRGQFEYRWTLEFKDDDSWTEHSTDQLLFFPFWRKKTEVLRQNTLAEFDVK